MTRVHCKSLSLYLRSISCFSDVPNVRRVHPPRVPARFPAGRPLARLRRLLLLRRLQQVPHGPEDDAEGAAGAVLERVRQAGRGDAAGEGGGEGEGHHVGLTHVQVYRRLCSNANETQSHVKRAKTSRFILFFRNDDVHLPK